MITATILIPVLGAFVVLCLGRLPTLQKVFVIIFTSLTSILAILRLPTILGGRTFFFQLSFFPELNLFFTADALASFMAFASSLIGVLIVVYSIEYMRDDKYQGEYYFFVLLFIGSMMGLVYAANLIVMYIFWEITAICSWRLIGHHNEPQHLLNADKAFLITVFGSTCLLIGFELLFHQTHTFDFGQLQGTIPSFGVALLIIAGIMGKSAQLPLQTWLPDAGVAPTPVTALLHAAVLVKIGAYAFARIFLVTLVLPSGFKEFFLFLILIGVLVSACAALVENDMKRILAYSTISQIGLILIGFALGNTAAVAGALFYIIAHGFSKAGLFLGVGVVDHYLKERDITKLRGMAKLFPVDGFGFFLCALSIMGIPPFGGFFAKVLIILGAIQQQKIVLALGIGLGAILSILYIMRLWTTAFMGVPVDIKKGRRFDLMSLIVIIFGIFSLLSIGLLRYPIDMIGNITRLILK